MKSQLPKYSFLTIFKLNKEKYFFLGVLTTLNNFNLNQILIILKLILNINCF